MEYVVNDKSLGNNINLLHKLAKRGFSRLQAAHVTIDYEDVFQEMAVAYCRAVEKFDVNRGVLFSTYCYRACLLEFNRFAEKMIAQSAISEQDLAPEDSDDEWTFFDTLASEDPSPEEAVEQMQEFRANIKKLPELARFVVARLVSPPQEIRKEFEVFQNHIKTGIASGQISPRQIPQTLNIDFIGRYYGFEREIVDRVKNQLEKAFGVQMGRRIKFDGVPINGRRAA